MIKPKKVVENTIKAIYRSIKRFPLTIGISTVLVVMLIITREQQDLSNDVLNILKRVNMIIALGIPLSLCINLIIERKENIKWTNQILFYVGGAVFLLVYYFFLLTDFRMVSMTRYIAVSIFMYLAFLYIPWIGRKEGYEFYVIKVLGSFFITVIYSFVLYFGVAAILFSIDKLFSVPIESKIYYYVFLVVAVIFAPAQFLSKIPYDNYDFSDAKYPKPLKILFLYIIIPLALVYMGILYAYFIKIIVTGDWPVGLVSHLVLWYSVITVGIIFFIFPIVKENKLAKNFLSLFPKVIIPIIVMMYFSIGLRINQYGVTENRYFVLVLGLWVLGIMVYFSVAKKFRNVIIPISLSIITLIAVFGPLSSFSISKWSQNKRLEKILKVNHMLEGEKIITASPNISQGDKAQVSMILDYFDNNHSLESVKYLSKDFKIEDMNKVFGFSFSYEENKGEEEYFYYDTHGRSSGVEIKGYDYLVNVENGKGNIDVDKSLKVDYNIEKGKFKLLYDGSTIYEKDLDEYVEEIYDKYKDLASKGSSSIDLKNMIFVDENEKVEVKFIFRFVGGVKHGEKVEINDRSFYVLVKMK